MAKKEDRIFIIYVIVFIIIAFVLSNLMFSEEEGVTISTHGVSVCNNNYDCGETDNVCPEDYGAKCIIADPDCE